MLFRLPNGLRRFLLVDLSRDEFAIVEVPKRGQPFVQALCCGQLRCAAGGCLVFVADDVLNHDARCRRYRDRMRRPLTITAGEDGIDIAVVVGSAKEREDAGCEDVAHNPPARDARLQLAFRRIAVAPLDVPRMRRADLTAGNRGIRWRGADELTVDVCLRAGWVRLDAHRLGAAPREYSGGY